MSRSGILAAGNFIIDHVKIIDVFPHQDGLANILSESFSNGGSPYNVLVDLALLKAPFSLAAAGLIGEDAFGQRIIRDCRERGIDTQLLNQTPEKSTSFTDVMTVQSSGRRTFFHQRGANALFEGANIDFSTQSHKIFHLGYLLLLDQLDRIEGGRSKASYLLEEARKYGWMTSVDVVSAAKDDFKHIIPSSLPFIDIIFLNEYEASKLTGIQLEADLPTRDSLKAAAEALFQMGVKAWVVIHFSLGVMAMNHKGESFFQAALRIPQTDILGASGAGDALAAGVLLGIHENWDIHQSLELGVCSAGASLFDASCSMSMKPWGEVLKLKEKYVFHAV